MAIQLLKLRGVPDDERAELHALLDEHGIEYYETPAGNWGISMPALWLIDEADYPRARALLDEYQDQRFQRARGEYEALRRAGKARGYRDIIRENPFRFVFYTLLVFGLAWISIAPFVSLGAGARADAACSTR